MDASQYKDYVLFLLFIKYISDKYGNSSDFAPPVVIPNGASFGDMVALKGKPDIGDKINTQIIQPLIDELLETRYPLYVYLNVFLNTTKSHCHARWARRAKENQDTVQPISGQQASIDQH
jgi:hypothetical protein